MRTRRNGDVKPQLNREGHKVFWDNIREEMVEISRLTLHTWVSFPGTFGQLLNRRLNATSCPLPFQVTPYFQ